MKFGLHLPNFGAFGEARLLAELAKEAEAAGWDGFFLWDHIARAWATPMVDPWIALGAIAFNTRKILLGALITPLPRRRPWKVARETVSLDRLSGGRLIFGAGIGSPGSNAIEWEPFGEALQPITRAAMLDEGLAVLQGLWRGEPFSLQGDHYTIQDRQFLPVPLQAPRIPVWIAGRWPNKPPFRRAARWDGVIPDVFPEGTSALAQFKEAVAFTQGERNREGPFDVVYLTPARPALTPAGRHARLAAFAEAGATWGLEELTPDAFGGSWQGQWPIEAMRAYVQQGPPAA